MPPPIIATRVMRPSSTSPACPSIVSGYGISPQRLSYSRIIRTSACSALLSPLASPSRGRPARCRPLPLTESRIIIVDSVNKWRSRHDRPGDRRCQDQRADARPGDPGPRVQPLLHQRHRRAARHVPGHAVHAHREPAAVRDRQARHRRGVLAAPGTRHRRRVPQPGAQPLRVRRPGHQAPLGGGRAPPGDPRHRRGPRRRGRARRARRRPDRRPARRRRLRPAARRHAGDHRGPRPARPAHRHAAPAGGRRPGLGAAAARHRVRRRVRLGRQLRGLLRADRRRVPGPARPLPRTRRRAGSRR